MDLKVALRAFSWMMISNPVAYFTSNRQDLLQTLCAWDCRKPGSQWAFGVSSSGIEWSVTRPWLTLSMEEASQTCHHLVLRARGPLRRECPWTSSATGPQTWEASAQVSIWIWAQRNGPRLSLSANGSRPWQRSWRRNPVSVLMNHRLESIFISEYLCWRLFL